MEVPSRFEIDDELWAEVEPLIPARPRRRRYRGRKPLPDRLVLNGILHVLHTGIAWEDLPQEYGYGSRGDGVAAAARRAAGRRLGRAAPQAARPAQRGGRDRWVARRRRRIACTCRFGGFLTGPSPVDRSRTGSKAPPLGRRDRDSARGRADGRQPQRGHAVDRAAGSAAPPAGRRHGRRATPEARPLVIADRGYDHDKHRRLLWARGIKPVIARPANHARFRDSAAGAGSSSAALRTDTTFDA